MGQKVNPIGLRLILNKKWQSRWFANRRDFGNYLQEDLKVDEALSQDSLALVKISKAKGDKCNRCWKYSQNCSETYGKLLCPRCAHVLEGQGL